MVITNVLDLIEACINSSFINYTGNDGNTLIALTLLIQDPTAAIGPLVFLKEQKSVFYGVEKI
ncbi:ABC transporter ATP-binding protein [Rickettsia tamurae]|uniref:ABC transporter ATP-binding protein n=1 Tax=Rickettsia tamurae TaxID=334545 RepID=UPI000AADCC74|nr:ABC transporter ATP-binding protein [Rickettsia tamurae]